MTENTARPASRWPATSAEDEGLTSGPRGPQQDARLTWMANLRALLATGMFGCIAWALSQMLHGDLPVATVAAGHGRGGGTGSGCCSCSSPSPSSCASSLEGPTALAQDVASFSLLFWNRAWDSSLSGTPCGSKRSLAFQPGEKAPARGPPAFPTRLRRSHRGCAIAGGASARHRLVCPSSCSILLGLSSRHVSTVCGKKRVGGGRPWPWLGYTAMVTGLEPPSPAGSRSAPLPLALA